MKYLRLFSLVFFTSVTLFFSCENDPIEPAPINGGNTTSDTRPTLRDGSINTTETIVNEIGSTTYENFFSAVELNNPIALGFVNRASNSAKKSIKEDLPGEYVLYEMANGEFQMIKGEEGNEITFGNIDGIHRINSEWQIITGDVLAEPTV